MTDPSKDLQPFREDWDRALAVVAHPDDMEYGAASAVARWTGEGKDVRYVLVTSGEAGIATIEPAACGPIREREQIASCEVVGVTDVEFLGLPDGLLEPTLDLRRALAGAIRRHRPDVVLSINHHDSWGGQSWNHADHRAVGVALLDAVRDASNPWVFTDQGEAWEGVQFCAFSGSPHPTHYVALNQGALDLGIRSLQCHDTYLSALPGAMSNPADFLNDSAKAVGKTVGETYATSFELI